MNTSRVLFGLAPGGSLAPTVTELCFALAATLSGARCVSVDGEEGLISVGLTGPDLSMLSRNLSGRVFDLIGASSWNAVPGGLITGN